MSRTKPFAATALAVLVGAAAAHAQPRPPAGLGAPRPTFSPYLNLLNRNVNPAVNYYGLVRPQFQFQQQANQIQQQLNTATDQLQGLNQQLASGADAYIPVTGRGATFNYLSHYYYNFPVNGNGIGYGGGGLGGAGFRSGGFNSFGGAGAGGLSGFQPGGGGVGRSGIGAIGGARPVGRGAGIGGLGGFGGVGGIRR